MPTMEQWNEITRAAVDQVNLQLGIGPRNDYDMAGYKAKFGVPDQSQGQHLTDEFKLPNHDTFSSDSRYSNSTTPGGQWSEDSGTGQWSFRPSDYNLLQHPAPEMSRYFLAREPNAKLDLPRMSYASPMERGTMGVPEPRLPYGSPIEGGVLGYANGGTVREDPLVASVKNFTNPVGAAKGFLGLRGSTEERRAQDGQPYTQTYQRNVYEQQDEQAARQERADKARSWRKSLFGFDDGGIIPGEVDPNTGDDTEIAAKVGEYVLPVEVVQVLGKEALDNLVVSVKRSLGMEDEPPRGMEPEEEEGYLSGGYVDEEKEPPLEYSPIKEENLRPTSYDAIVSDSNKDLGLTYNEGAGINRVAASKELSPVEARVAYRNLENTAANQEERTREAAAEAKGLPSFVPVGFRTPGNHGSYSLSMATPDLKTGTMPSYNLPSGQGSIPAGLTPNQYRKQAQELATLYGQEVHDQFGNAYPDTKGMWAGIEKMKEFEAKAKEHKEPVTWRDNVNIDGKPFQVGYTRNANGDVVEVIKVPQWVKPDKDGQDPTVKFDLAQFRTMSNFAQGLETKAANSWQGQMITPDGTVISIDGTKEKQDALKAMALESKRNVARVFKELTERYYPQWIETSPAAPAPKPSSKKTKRRPLTSFKGK